MTNPFSRQFTVILAVLSFTSFVAVPVADAAGGARAGNRGGGDHARAGGGGNKVQVNNNRADVETFTEAAERIGALMGKLRPYVE